MLRDLLIFGVDSEVSGKMVARWIGADSSSSAFGGMEEDFVRFFVWSAVVFFFGLV